jgi:hypothetical protein
MYKETAFPDVGNFMSKDTYITQSNSVQSRYIKHKTMVAQMYKETALPDVGNFMSKDTYITQSSSVQSWYIKYKTMMAQMYKETALLDIGNFVSKTLTLPNPVAYNLGTSSIKQWHLT